MPRNRLKTAVQWLPAIAVMGLIFYGSSRPDGPGPILRAVHDTVARSTLSSLVTPQYAAFLVQKAGHVGEYALLTWLVYRASRTWQSAPPAIPATLTFVFIFATSDEFHQAFVPGRSARARDVLIDMAGAALAIVIAAMVRKASSAELTTAVPTADDGGPSAVLPTDTAEGR